MSVEEWSGRPIEDLRFPGQLPNERVYLVEHRHWFVLLQWVWAPVALTLLVSLAGYMLTRLAGLVGYALSTGSRVLAWVLFLLPGCTWAVWRLLDWSNDRYIVTDCRVIHIDEIPLIRRRRDEAPLEMIQDVTVRMRGLWENLLHYGNVVSQTAGTLGTVRFIGIQKPRNVQALIQTLIGGARRREATPARQDSLRQIREVLGLPLREEVLVPPEADGLRWESERRRRQQLSVVLRGLFLADPRFGENQVIWRKHWWALLRTLVQPFCILAVIAILWIASAILLQYSPWIDASFGLAVAVAVIVVAWHTLDWRNDLYVITDVRVVDIEKVPLLAEERREARLDRIQDVRYDQPNLISRILGFGHVWLETAGEIGRFTFDYVPHPQEVQSEVFQRVDAYRQRGEQRRRQTSQEAFLELLARYHRRTRG